MSDFRNWNWAWSSVGTAINKHGGDLTPVRVAQLIEQGIEHGLQLAIASFELEDNELISRSPIGSAQRLRHVFYDEPEFDFSRYKNKSETPAYQKPCGDPECACS